jgi:hypothetical protein
MRFGVHGELKLVRYLCFAVAKARTPSPTTLRLPRALPLALSPNLTFPSPRPEQVDFGGATRDGATTTPAHSRRYVAPELAQALRISLHATIRVQPSLDIW